MDKFTLPLCEKVAVKGVNIISKKLESSINKRVNPAGTPSNIILIGNMEDSYRGFRIKLVSIMEDNKGGYSIKLGLEGEANNVGDLSDIVNNFLIPVCLKISKSLESEYRILGYGYKADSSTIPRSGPNLSDLLKTASHQDLSLQVTIKLIEDAEEDEDEYEM